ncbi:MAG: PIN domain-containing protein [Methanosarcinales archaeon]|nr:MAG: PIN domain-containing protein [Methanosarcinales archaeon]
MKVYIDSSTVIYAFEFKESNSRKILDLIIRREIEAFINQKVINEVKRFFIRNHGESIWVAVKTILSRHFELISEASYSAEKYRGMIKDKDLEHLAAFKDLKLDLLIAYDRDYKEISGYVTPKNFLIKMNKSFNEEFEF